MTLQEIFSITKETHACQFGLQNDLEDLEYYHFTEFCTFRILSKYILMWWCAYYLLSFSYKT